MNTKKTIFAIITAIAILLATLCGCGENYNDEIKSAQSSDDEMVEDKEDDLVEYCGTSEPLIITMSSDTNIKDEVIKHIQISKTIKKVNQDYWLYDDYKISDIKEFYSFDNFIINGYQLYVVGITEGAFRFRFVRIDNWKNEDFIEHNEADISMRINRPEWVDTSDPLKPIIEDADLQGEHYLSEGDMLFFPTQGNFFARMDDTLLYIRLPSELYDHEYLRELYFKLIETAELVIVGE